ncbi:MAG: DUF4942 domain-containing protein [Clostridia bacterium]|nr:DUF4942 domain-containing protein [Clostridia bacterium]
MSNLTVSKITEQDNQFYPTPDSFLEKIGIDFNSQIKSFCKEHRYDIRVLEPSAGKGNIADHLKTWGGYSFSTTPRCKVECVELDPNLRMILKGKNYPVVHDDFLTFDTYTNYDLIFMNPPFESADKHLLKAISMQERYGGRILCILNAETLRNQYTRSRTELVEKLHFYNAVVKFYSDAFAAEDSERKTNVEAAVVWIDVPAPASLYNSAIFDELDKAEQAQFEEVHQTEEQQALINMGLDWVHAYVKDYNDQVKSAVAFLREYTAFVTEYDARFGSIEGEASTYNRAFSLEVRGEKNGSINHFLLVTRRLYWKALFANPKFTGKLTNRLQDELRSRLDDMANIEFNAKNILLLMEENMRATAKGIEAEILDLFDDLTKHAQYDGCDNVHYYNGWKTNSAHKLNRKIIIPFYGVWKQETRYKCRGTYCYRDGYEYRLDKYGSIRKLTDISKTLNYLAKGICGLEDMEHLGAVIERNFDAGNAKNIETEHLILTFYKKGTCHLKFKNEDLLEKFNLFASQRKGWLPPSYGTKDYKNMTQEEQIAIDEFQGEAAYNRIMENKAAFIVGAPDLLMLGGARE